MPQKVHKALIASILKSLGHVVPSETELDEALRRAFVDIKVAEGVDPDTVKYKLSLTPVDPEWVRNTFP